MNFRLILSFTKMLICSSIDRLLNEASVNKVIGLIEDLEAKLKDIRLTAMVTGCSASLPTD